MMRRNALQHLVVVVGVIAAIYLFVLPMTAGLADEGTENVTLGLTTEPLVIVGSPEEASQLAAQREAQLDNPVVVAEREASSTAYSGLNSERQATLAGEAYPQLIDDPAGGPPAMPEDERVNSYVSDHAAVVALPEGQKGIIEAMAPIAVARPNGTYIPINLHLTEAPDGSFAPKVTAEGIATRIPRDISDGVSLEEAHVALTPVDAADQALTGSAGTIIGTTVFYGATAADSAVDVKPATFGFDLETLLYSTESPERLYFRVRFPRGDQLTEASSGVVQVLEGARTIAAIEPPTAHDAEGTVVPASLNLSGDTLTVTVDHKAGTYRYPIVVDPEVNDRQLATSAAGKRSNWEFHTSNAARFAHRAVYEGVEKEFLETSGLAEYQATEWAYWGYETKGNSKIYEFKTKTSALNKGAKLESFLQYLSAAGNENKLLLSTEVEGTSEYFGKPSQICGWNASKVEECLAASGHEKNAIHFQQSATASPGANFKFSDTMTEGVVSISEPTGTHSTTRFNTTSPEVEGEVEAEGKMVKQKRSNALYGSGSWLSKFQGALEPIAEDPGIGIAATRLEYEKSAGKWEQLSTHNYLEVENACQGIQCYSPAHKEYWTLDPKLPDGEDKIRYRAEEAMPGTVSLETEAESSKTVKVDTQSPRKVVLKGLPFGNELSEKPYTLVGEAIDGEGTTVASSGVKAIKLFISGREVAEIGKQTGCAVPKGECTALAEWKLNGAELGAGHHAIVIVVTDHAGNESRHEETLSVRHSTPVALGPGSVDLESGNYSLGATDVSLGSGLSITRNYSSRDLTQGEEGPIGPQWGLALTKTESLVELVDGGVLLTSANGSQSIFASLGEGKFEAPVGDSNLTLTSEENKIKQKTAYYLKDASAGTSVKFTRPIGSPAWVPTTQEGTVATDALTYTYRTVDRESDPVTPTEFAIPNNKGLEAIGLIKGPENNMWVGTGEAISVFTPSGTLVAEYKTTYPNEVRWMTHGPDGNIWFTGRTAISKITRTGAITEYPLLSGEVRGITEGPDGNLWFVNHEKETVGKITTEGAITEYPLPGGTSGPQDIALGSDGNLWVTVEVSHAIDKVTTQGVVTEYKLPVNSSPTGITRGADGNIWFTEHLISKIGMITPAGVISEYPLPEPAGPEAITSGPDGQLWFTDRNSHNLGRISTGGSVVEYPLPEGSEPHGIAEGPERTLWWNYSKLGYNKLGKVTAPRTMIQPLQALAPVPAKVSCAPELKPGCRALKFQYGATTTAKGEEWGDVQQQLSRVLLAAYNPATTLTEERPVAEYAYDTKGRLRAEWDPRISPALKTIYGYDEEGHLTAFTRPGQEPWTFTYGTIAGDAGSGRLLKIAQAPASTEAWKGTVPKFSFEPAITGSAVVGARLSLFNGLWNGSPITYAYKWQDCNTEGTGCTDIPGAVNPNYTVAASDLGHKLRALVTATNEGGSTTAKTATKSVSAHSFTQLVDSGNSLNAISCIPATTDCIATDSQGKAFYATNISSGGSATWTAWTGPAASPSEAVSCPTTSLCLMAAGSVGGNGGNLYYATSLGGPWTLAYAPGNGVDAISCVSASFCLDGQDNFGYFRYSTSPASSSWTLLQQGSAAMKGVFCLSSSFCAIADGAGNVHVATTTTQIESSGWTVTNVDGSSALNGVACTSTSSCVAVDGAGNVLNLSISGTGAAAASIHNIDGTNSLSAVTCSGTTCVTVDNQGNVFVSTNSGETWTKKFQPGGALTSVSCASTTLCAGANAAGEVATFNPAAVEEGGAVSPQPGVSLEYGVSLSGGSGLPVMTSSEVAKWGQQDEPVEGTAIIPPDSPQGWPASSYGRATVYYLDEEGRTTNVSTPSNAMYGSISTAEYNEMNEVVRSLTPVNRQTALEAGSERSVAVSHLLDTQNTYSGEGAKELEVNEPGTRLVESLGPQHMVKYTVGKETKESLARDHMKYFYDEGAPATGETYNLVTKKTSLVQLANEEEVEVRKTTTSYSGQSNLGWKLRAPTSVTNDPEGLKVMHTTLYNATTGEIIETRAPAGQAGGSAHDMKTIYYSSEANSEGYPACGNHPEWSGLVCEALPAKQPETAGMPKLPVTTVTYNIWDEPEVTTETIGSVTRTRTTTYDAAGRVTGDELISTAPSVKALPKVTKVYNETTGLLETESTTVEGKTKTITSTYNTFGQLISYTDGDGNVAKYTYGAPENDGLLEEMSDSSNGGTSRQVYTYDTVTKQLERLWDSAAETFSATYDAEGRMTSEIYPNGMCANTSYNATGEATHIEYIKTTNCSESKPTVWFSESRTPSARGETMSRSSTLASDKYGYDALGRLRETRETPSGSGCNVRVYVYDSESNRTSLTTRTPGTGGACQGEGGTVQSHTYDEANRMTDSGIAYDGLGNITKLPAADAEGHELVSSFYVSNAVASQTQNGVTNSYLLDPVGRIDETISGGKTTISHYDASGEAVAWSAESSEKWTRNIPGIDGTLSGIQEAGGTPVLELHDLEGNIVATASLNKEATGLASTYGSTEFGVPNGGSAPPKYAWLGAGGLSDSLSSGVITYGSTSYVPQTGRPLQSEAVEPPGAPGGTGAGAPYTSQEEPWNMQGAAAEAAEAPGLEAGREREAAEAACRANPEACGVTDGGEVDPTGIYTWQETEKKADDLNVLRENTVTGYEPYEEEFGCVSWICILHGAADYEGLAVNELKECAKTVKKYRPKGMCYVHIVMKELHIFFVGDFEYLFAFEVHTCTWLSGHQKKHESFMCPGAQYGGIFWEG